MKQFPISDLDPLFTSDYVQAICRLILGILQTEILPCIVHGNALNHQRVVRGNDELLMIDLHGVLAGADQQATGPPDVRIMDVLVWSGAEELERK